MKLRVLFILSDLEAGGAQRVILTVIRHINRDDFEPHLCIINLNGPLIKEIPKDIHLYNLGTRRVRYAIPGIINLCRSLKPIAVISTLGHLNLSILPFKFLLPYSTRLIIREANTPSIRLQYTRYPLLYRILYRRLYPLADNVICNSQYMKKDLLEFFSLSPLKTCVIPNPVDIKKIHESLENSPSPYKPGSIHLVSVGRLNYQKGYDLLLKILKQCLEKVKELHLTIMGEGSEEKSLKKMAAELELGDSVCFIGHQDNPYPFMNHADLFISSSRWEGLPNAVLESLACGTPVLAFDCPGGTNEIIVDDKNGWLVPSEDIEAMSGKIVALVRQKKWLKFKNEVLLPEKFICENVVRSYEKIMIKSNSDIISRSFAA